MREKKLVSLAPRTHFVKMSGNGRGNAKFLWKCKNVLKVHALGIGPPLLKVETASKKNRAVSPSVCSNVCFPQTLKTLVYFHLEATAAIVDPAHRLQGTTLDLLTLVTGFEMHDSETPDD